MKNTTKTINLQATLQKDYYGKARVRTENNMLILTSYNTDVIAYDFSTGELMRLWSGYSATTMKHINDFLLQNGWGTMNKKEWLAMPCYNDEPVYNVYISTGFYTRIMYWKYKNVDEIIKLLNGYKSEAEAKLELWKVVEVRKKKDGSEFAKLSAAVDGARFGRYTPVEDAHHPYLTVCGRTACGRWIEESVQMYYYVDELPAEKRNRDIIYGGGYLRETSPFNAEEVREAITKHIAYLEDYITRLEAEIENAPAMFTAFRTAVENAEKALGEADKPLRKGEKYPTFLYYAIMQVN